MQNQQFISQVIGEAYARQVNPLPFLRSLYPHVDWTWVRWTDEEQAWLPGEAGGSLPVWRETAHPSVRVSARIQCGWRYTAFRPVGLAGLVVAAEQVKTPAGHPGA